MPIIEVICVTYQQAGPLSVFIQSFLNQTAPNWQLSIYHDGFDNDFIQLMERYRQVAPDKIRFACTKERHNDWGHSLRAQALPHVTGDYVLITNGDNYYVPKFIEIVSKAIDQPDIDVVMYDMIHSHKNPGRRKAPAYSLFQTDYSRYNIDMGSAVVRSEIAKKVGFRDKGFDGDATYFEDIAQFKAGSLKVRKLNQVLFVHN